MKKDPGNRIMDARTALTYGTPPSYLSAGALAYMIASIIEGKDLETAVKKTLTELASYENHKEFTQSIKRARDLSKSNIADVNAVFQFGEG